MAKPVIFSVLYSNVNINPFLQGTKTATQSVNNLQQSGSSLQIEMGKVQARLLSTQTRFSALTQEQNNLTTSIKNNAMAVGQAQAQYEALGQRISVAQQKMAAASQIGNNRSAAGYRLQLNQLIPAQQTLKDKIEATESSLSKEQQRFAYVNAQIAVKSARIAELNQKIDQMNGKVNNQPTKPTGTFASIISGVQEAYGKVEKFVNVFNRVTLTMERGRRSIHRVVLVVNDISKLFTGKPLFAKAEESIDRTGKAADTAKGKVMGFSGSLHGAAGASSILTTSIGVLIGNVASFIAKLGVDAVSFFTNSLVQLGQTAVGVVANYERGVSALKAMVSQEMRAKDTTLGMNAAMVQAGPVAQKLTKWIEDLAILSPFSEEDVKQTFFLAKSYGFLVSEAKRVSSAILNWGAATGKAGYDLQRVILAMGQMRQTGKVLGQDIMQLAQVGINVKEILSKGLGMTMTEVSKKLQDGSINARAAIKVLTESLEKDWGDAAKAQAGTLSGLLSSIQDLMPRFLREFFGPMNQETGKLMGILGALQPYLQRLVDFLSSDSVLNGIRGIGIQLGELATKAFAWGEGFVMSFTAGLRSGVEGILGFISQVGKILTKWLRPSSPPLVAPNLDKWGEEAAAIYFGGFASEGATKVFADVSDKIENVLRSMSFGKDEDISLIPVINDIRKQVLQLSNELGTFGSVTSGVLDSITSKLGGAAGAVRYYIQSYAQLQQSQQQVALAQENLNRITQAYDDRLKSVRGELAGISEARQYRDEEKELKKIQRILNDPHASAARKQAAAERLREIQLQRQERMLTKNREGAIAGASAQLEDAQNQYAWAQQNFAIAQSQLEAIQKQNSLFEEQARLLQQIKDKTDDAGETGSLWPDTDLSGLDISGVGNLSETFSGLAANIENVKVAWSGFFDAIQLRWAQIQEFINGLMPTFQNVWQFAVDSWNLISPELTNSVKASLDSISSIWGEHQETIKKIIEISFKIIVATLITALDLVLGIISVSLKLMEISFHFWSLAIQGRWDEAWIYLRQSMTQVINDVLVSIVKWLQMISNIVGVDLGKVYRTWEGVFKDAYTIAKFYLDQLIPAFWAVVNEIKDKIVTAINSLLSGDIGGAFSSLLDVVRSVFNNIPSVIAGALYSLGSQVDIAGILGSVLGSGFFQALDQAARSLSNMSWMFFGVGWNIVRGIIDGIKGAAFMIGGALWEVVNSAVNNIKRMLGIASPSKLFAKIGKTIPAGLAQGIKALSFMPKMEIQATAAGMVNSIVSPPAGSQTAYNTNTVNNNNQLVQNLTVNSNRSSQGIQQDFRVMRLAR